MNQQERFFNAGEELPEALDSLWLILDGVVKSYTVDRQEKTIILGFWGEDEVVGKALSSVDPYYLRCLKDVRAIAIPKTQWQDVSQQLLNRIEQIQEISFIVRNSTGDRLWLLLQWLAQKFGRETPTGILIDFSLTPQELADALGMNVSDIENDLDRLRQQNLISQTNNSYTILQR
ncbi:MAG: Crp/Fnr family transcriptional regulator [Cyanobacteria bacterium P01_G01_bin.19]